MKKNYLKVVAALVGVAGAYFIYRYIKYNKKEVVKKPAYVITVPDPIKITEQQFNVGSDNYPLAKGSRGNNVKLLQKALNAALTVDGIFGSKTEAALIAQTGKKAVSSLAEIKAIGDKNDLGYQISSSGQGTFVPKSQQNILAKIPEKGFPF